MAVLRRAGASDNAIRIEGVAFGLLPLRFLAGEKVMAWSSPAWLAPFALGVPARVAGPTGG